VKIFKYNSYFFKYLYKDTVLFTTVLFKVDCILLNKRRFPMYFKLHLVSLTVCQLRSDGAKSGELRQSGASRGILQSRTCGGHSSHETFCVSSLLEKREALFATRLHTRRNVQKYMYTHTHTHTHTHIIYMYTYLYIHIYIYIYLRM